MRKIIITTILLYVFPFYSMDIDTALNFQKLLEASVDLWWIHPVGIVKRTSPRILITDSEGKSSPRKLSDAPPRKLSNAGAKECKASCVSALIGKDAKDEQWCLSEQGTSLMGLQPKSCFKSKYTHQEIGQFFDILRAVIITKQAETFFDSEASIEIGGGSSNRLISTFKRSDVSAYQKALDKEGNKPIASKERRRTTEEKINQIHRVLFSLKDKKITLITQKKELSLIFGLLEELDAQALKFIFVSELLSHLKKPCDLFSDFLKISERPILKFDLKIREINENYASREKLPHDRDMLDVGVSKTQVGARFIGNVTGTMYADIGTPVKIIVHDQVKKILHTDYWIDQGYISFFNVSFSHDGKYVACIAKVNDQENDRFQLVIWNTEKWRFKTYSLDISGIFYNMCLNHDATKALLSIMKKEGKYSFLILDLSGRDIDLEEDMGKESNIVSYDIEAKGPAKEMYWRRPNFNKKSEEFVTCYNDNEPLLEWSLYPEEMNTNIENFDFKQKALLYGIYERYILKKKEGKTIFPFITGYPQELILKSLPYKFKRWAEEAIKIIVLKNQK